jgi:hypothetical protein
MDRKLIEQAVDEYRAVHYYSSNEVVSLAVYYPIKSFQEKNVTAYRFRYGTSSLKVIPSLLVSSIVVAPRENSNV